MEPYRTPFLPGKNFKVVSVKYTHNTEWKRQLELELESLSIDSWDPILCGDGGEEYTVILRRDKA